jgi:hypothetical protein
LVTWYAFIGTLIGSLVTWWVARYYYKRAGDELRKEASELQRLIAMILTALEKKGYAKLNRDESGKIRGFVFEDIGNLGISFSLSSKTQSVPPTTTKSPDE